MREYIFNLFNRKSFHLLCQAFKQKCLSERSMWEVKYTFLTVVGTRMRSSLQDSAEKSFI